MGLDVETGRQSQNWDGKTVLIKRVKPDGAVARWCHERPGRVVEPGDRIVSANGLRGDALQILAECQKLDKLKLEIQRSPATAPKAPTPTVAPLRPPAEVVEEIGLKFREAATAAEAVALLRKELGAGSIVRCWDIRWGAQALLRIAQRSTARTRKAWAKDPVVSELVGRLRADISRAEDLADVEAALMALEGLKRLGTTPGAAEVALMAKKLRAVDFAKVSTKAFCRLLWLAAQLRATAPGLSEAAGSLRVLRSRPLSDFDGFDLRMLFDAARRWSESQWLQEDKDLRPGSILAKEVSVAEEGVLTFGLTLKEILEGWSLLFSFAPAAEGGDADGKLLPSLYVARDGRLSASFADSKESLKKDLEKNASQSCLQAGQLALFSLRRYALGAGASCAVGVDGATLLDIPCPASFEPAAPGKQRSLQLVCKDGCGTKVADGTVGHMVYRPLRSCPGKDVPLLQKLLCRLRGSDGEGLFPQRLFAASELVRLAEDLAHLELHSDEEALKSLGRALLLRRPELQSSELQLARGAFAMLGLPLQQVWASVGAKQMKRGGAVVTKQAFAPVLTSKRQKVEADIEVPSPPPSPESLPLR